VPTHRITVSGKVQGVFFRAETKRQADILGLTGWVRNTDDGSVEILAQGDAEILAELERWARRGPGAAEVTGMKIEEIHEAGDFEGFTIAYV
jgi:acylphosphatase